MNTTVRIKASEIYKDWHVIDAAGRPLGRVASEAAILLRGKHKPTYEPHLDDGDFVVIINAGLVKMTGRKAEQNKYYTHSGYPGGLRTRTFADQFARYPERVIEKSVWGMLPGGTLGEAMLKHLKVYRGAHHPHQSQITGSERARAARSEAQAAALGEPMKAPRLRTLSVPAVIVAPEPKAKPVVAEKPKRRKAPTQAVAAAAVTEKPKRTKAATEAVAAAAVTEKPKRRKAPTEAVAATYVTEKPKRRKAPTGAVAATDVPAETISASKVTQAEPKVAPARGVTSPEATIAAEKKPRRTRANTAEASGMKVAEAAAKPRARRKAAEPAAEAAAATETPKPARKRATPKIEE